MVQTTLVILTFNEIEGLKKLFHQIPLHTVDEYFVVDFQSTDGTVEFLRKHNVRVITQTKAGRSEAFRIGRKHALGKILIFFSPDGNENPSDIPKLIATITQGYDLVIASRFLPTAHNEEDDHFFRFRAWANMLFTFIANILFRKSEKYITDSINGFRAIKKDSFDSLRLDVEGFAIEYQMTIRALKKNLAITEIPTYEGSRIGGKSTASSIPTGIRFLRYLVREILIGNSF